MSLIKQNLLTVEEFREIRKEPLTESDRIIDEATLKKIKSILEKHEGEIVVIRD